jgi:Ethanolamine utilization protein EutJ (predicted chaperonin)
MMKKPFLVGVDLGVSLIKIGIYDINGNCIETVIKE